MSNLFNLNHYEPNTPAHADYCASGFYLSKLRRKLALRLHSLRREREEQLRQELNNAQELEERLEQLLDMTSTHVDHILYSKKDSTELLNTFAKFQAWQS